MPGCPFRPDLSGISWFWTWFPDFAWFVLIFEKNENDSKKWCLCSIGIRLHITECGHEPKATIICTCLPDNWRGVTGISVSVTWQPSSHLTFFAIHSLKYSRTRIREYSPGTQKIIPLSDIPLSEFDCKRNCKKQEGRKVCIPRSLSTSFFCSFNSCVEFFHREGILT
jgi:hypothetical protein